MKELLYESLVNTTEGLTLGEMVINFAAAALIACLIYISYRVSHSGAVYSERFNVSLVMLTLISTLVMNVIGHNIALSLGMVGALSIVRFRTAIKDPRDTAYIFWAIAVGIVIGAGMIPLAVIGSVIIGVILILFANRRIHDNPYILIFNCRDEKAEESAIHLTGSGVERFVVKSKTVNGAGIEVTAEVRLKDAGTSFVNRLNDIEGVNEVTLVSYNGEYMS